MRETRPPQRAAGLPTELPWEAAHTQEMGAICGKVETQGESRKEVEEDLRIDNRKRNSLIFAVIEWVSAVDGSNRVKDQEKLARSRRFEVLRRLHAIEATRVHLTMKWLFEAVRPRRPRS